MKATQKPIEGPPNLDALQEENGRLREEVNRYRRLKARSRDFVYIHDLDGNFLECNEAMLRRLGCTSEEAARLRLKDIIHPEDMPIIERAVRPRTTKEGTGRNWEVRVLTKAGKLDWMDFNAWPVKYKGQVCIQGVGRITTDRREAEAEAKAQAEFLRTVVDTAPDLIFVKDENLKFQFVNKTLAEHYGPTPENLVGSSDPDYCENPAELATFKEDDLKALREGRAERLRETVTNKRGEVHTYKTVKVRIKGKNGKPAVLGVSANIDYLVEAEQKLQQAKQALEAERDLLNTLMNAIPDAIYFKDKEGRFLRVNQSLATFVGAASPDEVCGKTDRDFFSHELAASLAEEERRILNGGDPVVNSVILMKQGDRGVYRARTKVAIREQGNIIGLIGISRDVTKEQKDTDEIRETKTMLEHVLNAVPQCIFWKNSDFVYRGCNAAFLKRHGKASTADIVGKDDFALSSPEDAARYRSFDNEVIEVNRPILHRRESQIMPNGERAILEVSKLPLHDGYGTVTGVLGVLEDVSKKMEHYEDLVRFVSHSMKARLTVLEGNLSLLKTKLPDDPDLVSMRNAIELLKGAVLRARNFSLFGLREPLALVAVNPILAKLRDATSDPRATFEESPCNPYVLASALDLENSLLELVTNAVRFARKPEVGGFIRVWAEAKGGRCRIHVHNNGCGLPKDPANLDRYIPPLDPQRPGVGLAFALYTVEKLGGKLTEIGLEGVDAHFVVDLELCPAPKAMPHAP